MQAKVRHLEVSARLELILVFHAKRDHGLMPSTRVFIQNFCV